MKRKKSLTTNVDIRIAEMNNSQDLQIEGAEQIQNLEIEDSRKRFSIGEWNVIPELNRLQHRTLDLTKQLEPRLVNLLCYLANNQNRVICREELVQELWPRVIVNENSLTRAVSELRKQLRSSNSELNYIETIPKKGYRLLVPVLEAQESEPAGLVQQGIVQAIGNSNSSRTSFLNRKHHTSFQAAAAMVAVVASLALYPFSDTSKPDDSQRWIDSASLPLLSDQLITPEADYMGGELSLSAMDQVEFDSPIGVTASKPVIDNDNNQYAYIKYDHSGSTIFLGSMSNAVEPLAIYSNDAHLFNLAWSPVGNSLLFARKSGISSAVVYGKGVNNSDELFSLNLDTMVATRLIPDNSPALDESINKQRLT